MRVKKNIKEVKKELRGRYRSYREGLPKAEKQQMDRAVYRRLIHLSSYQTNRVIFI